MDKGKRKRSEKEEEKEEEAGAKRARDREEAHDEEVEEFFAILRRMKVAVKYFKKSGREGWREAVEAEVAAALVDNGNNEDGKRERTERNGTCKNGNGFLDLNVVPVGRDAED